MKANQTRGKTPLSVKRATVKDLKPRGGGVSGGVKSNIKA
jgi:hypothetical protein